MGLPLLCLPVIQEGNSWPKADSTVELAHSPRHRELHLDLVRHQDPQDHPVYALLYAAQTEKKNRGVKGSRESNGCMNQPLISQQARHHRSVCSRNWWTPPSCPSSRTFHTQVRGGVPFLHCSLASPLLKFSGQDVLPGSPRSASIDVHPPAYQPETLSSLAPPPAPPAIPTGRPRVLHWLLLLGLSQ